MPVRFGAVRRTCRGSGRILARGLCECGRCDRDRERGNPGGGNQNAEERELFHGRHPFVFQ